MAQPTISIARCRCAMSVTNDSTEVWTDIQKRGACSRFQCTRMCISESSGEVDWSVGHSPGVTVCIGRFRADQPPLALTLQVLLEQLCACEVLSDLVPNEVLQLLIFLICIQHRVKMEGGVGGADVHLSARAKYSREDWYCL